MKYMIWAVLCCSLGCSVNGGGQESLGEVSDALTGEVSPGFLIRRNISSHDETQRESDTASYYNGARVGVDPSGGGQPIGQALPTLSAFKTKYTFGQGIWPEATAYYYNRGDLGLGREMHCVDLSNRDGQIACYVTNHAAGDDNSEFTFGLSANVAFQNMAAHNDVATVAMVYRAQAGSNRDKVVFIVYDGNEQRAAAAPLDRYGINFAVGFKNNGSVNPDPVQFGVPGVDLNNHIPSNCLNCHGGQLDPATHAVTGAVFLPFDLDQFEYEDVAGRRRTDPQVLTQFRSLNQMVRKVAVGVAGPSTPIVNQIDGWYGNVSHSPVLSGSFDPAYVPAGWGSAPDVYFQVARRSCRGCHMTFPNSSPPNALQFESAQNFIDQGVQIAADLVSHTMPHALQTQREFWQSSQPLQLETFLRNAGAVGAANLLSGGSATDVVTLDPPLISALY